MTWPRGRYNGRRIVGITVKVTLDVTWWRLAWFGPWGSCASLGPIHVWVEAAYADRRRDDAR